MFAGKFNHSIDNKGRIIVPSKFREALGDTFVVTRGVDDCLNMYSNEEWEKFLNSLTALPSNKEGRQLIRHFMAGAAECEIDKQGRVLIPADLRAKAGLEKDVIFVGVLNKIEIWSKEHWEENDNCDAVEDMAEHLAEYGVKF